MSYKKLAVIGGGAAGIFGALTAKESHTDLSVTIFEASQTLLDKVKISGGGRCNVTHHCFNVDDLVKNYPRGSKELKSAFSRFQPKDTINWFKEKHVKLKTEEDGRMFPVSDSSQTIIDCFTGALEKNNITVQYNTRIKCVQKIEDVSEPYFELADSHGNRYSFDTVLLTSGNSKTGYEIANSLGHSIKECIPSLFTFKITDDRLQDLSGLTFHEVESSLRFDKKIFTQTGPMVITHWGLSGPAILKLSAFAAKELYHSDYKTELTVNFLPGIKENDIRDKILSFKKENSKKQISTSSPFDLPKRFWQRIISIIQIQEELPWSQLSSKQISRIIEELSKGRYRVNGKGIFKEEFVTCGGVDLKEVDFKTMQSKICPGLFFGGEILDIDGITGGFNFQSAWTTGFIAGKNI